nr:deleted in lung and esophageal cancer protein 1 [Anolis sagrei ordinatus]
MQPSGEGDAVGRQSPEPTMYRHRPTSELTQDISHLLASVFKNMYTSEVIGVDTVENMIKSRGGDNVHHEEFVKELQKVRKKYKDELAEADMLERHIIQARARATAEEERILNEYKDDVPEGYRHIALPPVKSTFRWCVDDELLEKHNLISPKDYITDPELITRAPKEISEPGYLKEIESFQHHISDNSMSTKLKESPHIKKLQESFPDVSLSSFTMESSTTDVPSRIKKSFIKSERIPRAPGRNVYGGFADVVRIGEGVRAARPRRGTGGTATERTALDEGHAPHREGAAERGKAAEKNAGTDAKETAANRGSMAMKGGTRRRQRQGHPPGNSVPKYQEERDRGGLACVRGAGGGRQRHPARAPGGAPPTRRQAKGVTARDQAAESEGRGGKEAKQRSRTSSERTQKGCWPESGTKRAGPGRGERQRVGKKRYRKGEGHHPGEATGPSQEGMGRGEGRKPGARRKRKQPGEKAAGKEGAGGPVKERPAPENRGGRAARARQKNRGPRESQKAGKPARRRHTRAETARAPQKRAARPEERGGGRSRRGGKKGRTKRGGERPGRPTGAPPGAKGNPERGKRRVTERTQARQRAGTETATREQRSSRGGNAGQTAGAHTKGGSAKARLHKKQTHRPGKGGPAGPKEGATGEQPQEGAEGKGAGSDEQETVIKDNDTRKPPEPPERAEAAQGGGRTQAQKGKPRWDQPAKKRPSRSAPKGMPEPGKPKPALAHQRAGQGRTERPPGSAARGAEKSGRTGRAGQGEEGEPRPQGGRRKRKNDGRQEAAPGDGPTGRTCRPRTREAASAAKASTGAGRSLRDEAGPRWPADGPSGAGHTRGKVHRRQGGQAQESRRQTAPARSSKFKRPARGWTATATPKGGGWRGGEHGERRGSRPEEEKRGGAMPKEWEKGPKACKKAGGGEGTRPTGAESSKNPPKDGGGDRGRGRGEAGGRQHNRGTDGANKRAGRRRHGAEESEEMAQHVRRGEGDERWLTPAGPAGESQARREGAGQKKRREAGQKGRTNDARSDRRGRREARSRGGGRTDSRGKKGGRSDRMGMGRGGGMGPTAREKGAEEGANRQPDRGGGRDTRGKFPGEGGLIAPGMSCYHEVQFIPEYLSDYDDYILVESQAPYPFFIPLKGRRPPPVLTLPSTLDCGACLVGGVKFTQFPCKNEGSSTGKFCIMPKGIWPPPNFRAVATFGYVEQDVFGIHPAVFELAPGQSTVIEVVFMPILPETFTVTYLMVCDNCQINEITVTGLGQLIALELFSVTGGESHPLPGELTDVTAQHLIRFDSLNPYSVAEKILVLRNMTHVELPFFWQIMKPNLQPLMLEGKVDLAKIKYNLERESAFSLTPSMGKLPAHSDFPFTLTFAPKKLRDYHSVLQIVLEDIPELPNPQKPWLYEVGENRQEDVIALEIDVKGHTEPLQLLLEPYAIIIPGENYIGVNIRRLFKMYNNSKSPVVFAWEKISDCDILEVEPSTGKLGENEFCEFEFTITGGNPGHSCHKMECKIAKCTEPVVLHVEADFKGPLLSVSAPSLDLGLLKLGEKVSSTFQIQNVSQLPGRWKMQESPVCIAEREEETSPFTIEPSSGELGPLDVCSVSVLFSSYMCQRLQTVLVMEVENGTGSHILVNVEVQSPQVCLLSSHLHFDLSVGIPAEATIKLFNQTLLPTRFKWGEPFGRQASSYTVSITPESGILGPNEEKELRVGILTHSKDELKDLTLCCSIEDMLDPIFLAISGEVKGLHVTYSVPSDSDEKEKSEDSQELKLDFGSEVALKSVVKRHLIITNHSELAAFFTIEVDYFSSPSSEEHDKHADIAVEKTRRITRQTEKRQQSAFKAAMLSHGKGATFHVCPSTGTLKAFEELSVEITAYNNMWGHYEDTLSCKVGESDPVWIPIQMTVKGCPIYLQVTGPNHPMATPVIRFGAHISGGDTVSRYLRLNNPTPFDIRMDWETYNQDKDDDKLVDLLVFYGAPFPIKDLDGNEIEVIWESEPSRPKISFASTFTSSLDSTRADTSLGTILEDDEGGSDDDDTVCHTPTPKQIISVVIRAHEGVPSDYPFCITPKQVVVPAEGNVAIHISFTPLMLPEIINKFECEGFALGFMSLDSPVVQEIPGKVIRGDGHAVAPLRIDLQAFVKPALLTIEMDHESGLEFHALASGLIPDMPLKGVLIDSPTTLNVKLTNNTETPLSFKLILTMPFSISGVDPKKSLQICHSEREEDRHCFLLYALENMLLKVSFHTTLELLTYQHLPEDQIPPGLQVLNRENGDKILEFKQDLVIEYSNKATQVLPMTAYLTVPLLELSCDAIDFGTCLVNQKRTEAILVMNKSGCRSYWAALLNEEERHKDPEVFSISPNNGILEAHVCSVPTKEILVVRFTAREDKEYETIVTIVGMLGEKPCLLYVRGKGSYDEKYEERLKT